MCPTQKLVGHYKCLVRYQNCALLLHFHVGLLGIKQKLK